MRTPTPATSSLISLALVAFCVVLPSALLGGTPEGFDFYLHGLSADGRSSINGTVAKKYASDFRFDIDIDDNGLIIITGGGLWVDPLIDIDVDNPDELWSAFHVDGADRYALRRDGVVRKNDKKVRELFGNFQPWLDMDVHDGRIYAIRIDGTVDLDGLPVASYPTGPFHFRRIRTDGEHYYSLRTDGTVFRDDETIPFVEFRAGRLQDFDVEDGESLRTVWIDLELDPTGTFLYALRSDGAVSRALIADDDRFGEPVASLPYLSRLAPLLAHLYFDLVFTSDGIWHAITGNGRVYTSDNQVLPLVDLPGNGDRSGHLFRSLASLDDSFFSMRSDGRVYQDESLEPIYDLPGNTYYGRIGLSRQTPVLATKDQKKPVATLIKPKLVVGTPLVLPVVVTDVSNCTADLAITPRVLPPGSVWVPEISSLAWDAPGPAGRYEFEFEVSDGVNSPKFTYVIKVEEPDTDPARNKAPLRAKYKKAQLVVGQEYVLPVIVDDPDGDDLVVSVNEMKYPFTTGASFDPATRTFRWTPTTADQGKTTVKFKVNDGGKQKTIAVTMKVKNGLFF